MRLAGIGHIEDVAWAILETQGKISFIQRSDPGGSGGEEPPPNPPSQDDDRAA
jgi:uncharacterized membrane protein YcaP (DUF421 family)